MGCPNCWEHFEQELDAVIRRVQSENIQHTGKVPKKWKEKQKTKSQKPKNPVKSETPSQEEKEPDYANMSQKDLQNLMDASIDSGDYALANKISQYIK